MEDKVRVFEIAEEAGVTSSIVIEKSTDLSIILKSPQSSVSFEMAEEIANYIMTGKSNLLKKRQQIKEIHNDNYWRDKKESLSNTQDKPKSKLINNTVNIDYIINKRLQIIKLSIELKDIKTIDLQVEKLTNSDTDSKVKMILEDLLFTNYVIALENIENYLNEDNNNIDSNKNKELNKLNKELIILLDKLLILENEKNKSIAMIDTFNKRYVSQLGDDIKEILDLEMTLKKENNEEFQDKKKEYNEFIKFISSTTTNNQKKSSLETKGLRIVKKKSDEEIKDIDLLQQKIKSIHAKIENVEVELEDINKDETFLTLLKIEDMDEYFKDQKLALEEQLVKIKKGSIIENDEIEEWVLKLWEWADENGISSSIISKDKNKLLNTKTLDFLGQIIDNLPKEIINLNKLKTLILWDCGIKYLPKEIVKLTDLKKLNLRGNTLSVTPTQKKWIDELAKKGVVFTDKLNIIDITSEDFEKLIKHTDKKISKIDLEAKIIEWIIYEIRIENKKDITTDIKAYFRVKDDSKRIAQELIDTGISNINLAFISGLYHFSRDTIVLNTFINTKVHDKIKTTKEIEKVSKEKRITKEPEVTIKIENNEYSKKLQNLTVPSFEKIRRHCNNLLTNNQSDAMQEYLAKNGKMHKALIYDALEQFIERLDGYNITLIDWGSEQGIGISLTLDYIREKQLDIKIDKIILIDDNIKALSRTMLHVDVLKQTNLEIITLDSTNSKSIETINQLNDEVILNIFVNDKMPIDYLDIDYDIFHEAYFVCISNNNNETINEFYENINDFNTIDEIIADREVKIGKFNKYEKIFKTIDVPIIDIDNDEIPF